MKNKYNILPYWIWGLCIIAIGIAGILCNELFLLKMDSMPNKKHDSDYSSLLSKYNNQLSLDNIPQDEQKNIKVLASKIAYTRCYVSWTVGSYTAITHLILINIVLIFSGILIVLIGYMRGMKYEIDCIRNPSLCNNSIKESKSNKKIMFISLVVLVLFLIIFLVGIAITLIEMKNGIKSRDTIDLLYGATTWSIILLSALVNILTHYYKNKQCNKARCI